MPLTEDSLWNRGKCSFKMLTYMACGIPVIVSPVGMNQEVLNLGNCGLSAANILEWEDNLAYLINNLDIAQEMGKTARRIIMEYFSLEILSSRLAQVMIKTYNADQ
jgi:glycosyltransferase involved in cell wall biosynthesis